MKTAPQCNEMSVWSFELTCVPQAMSTTHHTIFARANQESLFSLMSFSFDSTHKQLSKFNFVQTTNGFTRIKRRGGLPQTNHWDEWPHFMERLTGKLVEIVVFLRAVRCLWGIEQVPRNFYFFMCVSSHKRNKMPEQDAASSLSCTESRAHSHFGGNSVDLKKLFGAARGAQLQNKHVMWDELFKQRMNGGNRASCFSLWINLIHVE